MVKFLINRRISVYMTFVAILILAWQSGKLLSVSLLPNISIPEITVHLQLDNASARELEQTAVKMVREQLLQLNNLRHIESEARQESAQIRIQLEYGTDTDLAFIEVNEKIDQAMNFLPKEMERPRVIQAKASDLPVFYLHLSMRDSSAVQGEALKWLEFSKFSRQVIRRRLEQLPELALVDISGYAESEIYIIPDEEKMKSLNIEQSFIQQIIEKNNVQLGNILIQDREYQYMVQLDFQLKSVEDIRNLYFKHAGQLMQLKDIATVGLRQETPKGIFLTGSKPAIKMAIIKHSKARIGDLENAVHQLIHLFEQEYPDIQFALSQDQASLLRMSIQNLQQSLLLGCILVVLILFAFMRNWRMPAIVGVSVPIALLISLIFFYLLDLSINIISLSGLIMGVGLMIDNAVIVVDNIAQAQKRRQTLDKSCVEGTEEVILPLISSALTSCAIFLPLVFISGIAGVLFLDQALAITIGLGVSLLVSITLIPTLYRSFFVDEIEETIEEERPTILSALYSKGVQWVFRYPFLSLFMACGFVVLGGGLAMQLPRQLLPHLDKDEMLVNINWNKNLSINENQRRVVLLTRHFRKEIKESGILIGPTQYLFLNQGPSSSNEVELYLKAENSFAREELEKKLWNYIGQLYPSARIHFRNSETIFDRIFPEEPILKAAISSKELTETEQIEMLHEFQQLVGYPKSPAGLPATEDLILLEVLPEQLLLYDVQLEQLYNQLKKTLNSRQVSLLRTYQDRLPIVVSARPKQMHDLLDELYVNNSKKIAIPVRSLIRIKRQQQFQAVYANKSGSIIPLAIETDQPAKTIRDIQRFAAQYEGTNIQLSGRYYSSHSNMVELLQIMLVAIGLLYFILAAQFGSFVQPLIILLEIPISLSGAIIALYYFGSSINLLSMIGMIVLTGIIINDSILKVDTINRLRKENLNLKEAIHEGGLRRLRPIIMTSLTTILALMPFLFRDDMSAQLQRPLALALIGGMLVGTLVSLYVIPLLYYGLYRKS